MVTSSVSTHFLSRAFPAVNVSVPARTCSSERGIASSVVGPDVSCTTVPADESTPVSEPLSPSGSPLSERLSE